MTSDDLLALTIALYPFKPDEDDWNNETADIYTHMMEVTSQALPGVYYAGMEAAWAGKYPNPTIADGLRAAGFIIFECVSEAGMGIRCQNHGSHINSWGIEKEEIERALESEGIDPATMNAIWDTCEPSDDTEVRERQNERLAELLCSLTGEPMANGGLSCTTEPPTDRQCLGWLLTWAFGITGNPYLDYTDLQYEYGQMELPNWDTEEIEYALECMCEIDKIKPRISRGWEIFDQHRITILNNLTKYINDTEKAYVCTWPF
jgi:hypothetical protein